MLQVFDIAVMGHINQLVGSSRAFDTAVRIVADWNYLRCAPLVAMLWWYWFQKEPVHRRTIATGVAAACLAALVSRLIQALFFVHVRPFAMAAEFGFEIPDGVKTDWGTGSSFPSDTTALHVALATVLFFISKRVGIFAFAWTAFLIAFPRVYLTYHWPSDIVAGSILAILIVYVADRVQQRLKLSDFVATFPDRYGPAFYAISFLLTFQITSAFEDVNHVLTIVRSLLK